MKIAAIKETDVIDSIRRETAMRIPPHILGIGDDCAVVPQDDNHSFLISTDSLVEDVHFLRNKISATELGHKAIAVNLSDIAAMGGEPEYALLSLALPADLEVAWLKNFTLGMNTILEKHNVLLLGGDTTRSEGKIFINVTIVGKINPTKIKYRSTAQLGDIICVTGNLGDSAAGLEYLIKDLPTKEISQSLIMNHLLPRPHLREGQFLADFVAVHAMMDVSDGINADLQRIMQSSQCGVEIYLEELPISEELLKFAKYDKLKAFTIAAIGGEDYCLLVTIAKDQFAEIAQQFQQEFQQQLTAIGRITKQDFRLQYLLNGKQYKLKQQGFRHFG
jgi:thiamine-monophosphate kinase